MVKNDGAGEGTVAHIERLDITEKSDVDEKIVESNSNQSKSRNLKFTSMGHAKALLSKNWYRITRHPG